MTQEELADKVGIHLSTLGRIERGESNPPLQTVNKIAQALKIKPKELF
jgi:transcriptional regulator with XRE-family HTH domain